MSSKNVLFIIYLIIILLYLSKASFSDILNPDIKKFLNDYFFDLFFFCYLIIIYINYIM